MSDGRIVIDTEVDSLGAEKDIKTLNGKLGSMANNALGVATKTTAAMVTVAAGAVAALTKVSIEQYAEYEQLVGGVETLFKNSNDKVMEYANNAYKSAGMSANEYMSTITGFAASLLQGLGGDTEKAAQIGNLAVEDMADNANKMGTAIENIQNAYQGFAKQNYTMLDNLKLGYGGTKEEMERLLDDAEKLTGTEFDISNFNDVIEAIHAIQTEMGITGTTAKEAASTIEGSLSMTKSAWTNLLTGMADDNADFDTLVNNLVDSLGALGENLLPRIEVAIKGIGKLVEKLLPPMVAKLPEIINDILPSLLNAGVNMVTSLVNGIKDNLPAIATGAMGIVNTLASGIVDILPMLLDIGLQTLITIGKGIAESLPTLIPTIVNLVISMCDMIIENLPLILDVAIDIILALVQGLVNALPTLISEVPRIINSFANAIYSALPTILKAGIDIIIMLVKGLIQAIPTIIANLPQIIMAIVNVFTLFNWASIGKNLVTNIGGGIKSMVTSIGTIAKDLGNNVVSSIKGIFSSGGSIGSNLISAISGGISNMLSGIVNVAGGLGTSVINSFKSIFGWDSAASIGSNLIRGIWSGISNMSGWILNLIGGFAGNIISGIKDFFDIHSPSRVMQDLIGVNIVRGIGAGIDVETPNLQKDIDSNMSDLVAKMKGVVDYETAMTTAKVVSYSNGLSGGKDDNSKSSEVAPVTLNIENFNNNREQDIEQLCKELEFYRKRVSY